MILFKTCIALISCIVVNGHVKRGLGFTGLGTYHGDSDEQSSNLHISRSKQINDRQDVASEYTSGLANFASVGHTDNLANETPYFHSNHINARLQSNPSTAQNFELQSDKSLGISINPVYGTGITGVAQNVMIPLHQSVQPNHFSPLRQVVFSGLPNRVHDYRNTPLLPATSPVMSFSPQTSFGIRVMPVNDGQALFGRSIESLTHGNVYMASNQGLGGYPENQQLFQHISPQFPIVQNHAFDKNTVGYQAGGHQQMVNNPHFESGSITQYHRPESTFPSANVVTGNTHSHNYKNPAIAPVSSPETQQPNHSIDSSSDTHKDNYSNSENQYDQAGSINSVNHSNNKESEEVNSDYQDFNNNNPASNDYTIGNSAEAYQNQPGVSQEVQGDSVGSYVNSGDSSQNSNYANSGEQNYVSDQGNTNAYDQSKNGHNTEPSNSLVTNGHAVGDSGEKATSFQSFVIHSYKPKRVFTNKIIHKSFIGAPAQIKSHKSHHTNNKRQ